MRKSLPAVVLTGGPCAGKTTVTNALAAQFGDQIVFVPEVATVLLEGGFPLPGRDLQWSEAWQATFQRAVLPLQHAMEDAMLLRAHERGAKLLLGDRGILDGAAYTPGGADEFCRRYGVDRQAAIGRYAAVIHLESLAVADPSNYGRSNNASRFETLERAQELEAATRAAWADHPTHIIVDGRRGLEGKIEQTIAIVRSLLSG